MKFIDNFLNKTTMYRLVLYFLLSLLFYAVILSSFGILHYSPLSLVISTVFITTVCWATNLLFSWVFKVPTNTESIYITALILVFIITPIDSFSDMNFYILAFWASTYSMATKYILAIRKKHIFNPAAIAVVLTSFIFGLSASWWIGTSSMLVPIFIGGFLVAKKVRRFDFVMAFLISSFLVIVWPHISGGFPEVWRTASRLLLSTPIIFFAGVMLTEPLTTPPAKNMRIIYGVLVGLLFSPLMHIGSMYSTPELALIAGNIFSFFVSPKEKFILKLKRKAEIANDTYEFTFQNDKKGFFKAGQYLEWTLAHKNPDNRGNRRYLTVASSPTEDDIKIGVKFYPNSSSFKEKLLYLGAGDTIIASQRAGEFVLPKNIKEKMVFISGGIGITPFRSIAKYLLDTNEHRDLIHFYSNRTLTDIAYADILDAAQDKLGVRTIYTLTDKETIPPSWLGEIGFIDRDMIIKYVPDYMDRTFYLSGPHAMVTTFEKLLASLGVKRSKIKKDYFPGFV